MIETDKDEKFRDLSASMLKNINPENIILLLRLSRKLNIQQYHPVLEIFANDQGGIETIDSVLDFASSQIGKGDIASWDVQTATTLGFYLAMVKNQLKKDDSGEFAKKVIDFGAAVINNYIENIVLFAQKTIDTADDNPLQLLCSKYFDEQAKVSCRTKMYEAQQWGSYKDTKNIFKFDKFGLDGLLALIKNTENVKKDNVISIGGVGGLFALETAAEMFEEKYNTEKIVKITFQMFCDLITASIEKLQKIEQLKTVSAQNIDALVIAGVKLANSSIFNNLEKIPLKEFTTNEKVESLLNELLLGELMKLIDLSLDEGSVTRSFIIGSHEGIRLVLDQRLLPNQTLVNEETVLKIFQYIVLITNESYGLTCQFLKILLTHRSADVTKTKMKLLTDELLNLVRAESATQTDVSELLEIINAKCERTLLESIATELIAQISKGATAHDLKQLVEIANLVQADKEENESFGEGETSLGYGHVHILREIEKVLEELPKTIDKNEKLYPAFEYLTQLSIYLSMDDESRWMSDVVSQFTRGKQDTPRSEKAAKDAKLCTYTHTQREFQSQHWYHCHSCNMVDSVGVCSTCAVVCHEGHNLSYAKHSSFFCDCGAQDRTPGRRSCIALTPRSPGVTPGKKQPETGTSAGIFNASEEITLSINITNPLIRERCKDALTKMIPKIEAVCVSLESSSKDEETAEEKARALLDRFQKTTKATVNNYIKADFQTNQGALENVKPSLSPDGNEAIRKVLLENSIHRNFVGVLEENREKYIVVLQDKNKMSLLALSTLLSRKSNSSTNAVSRQSHYTASFTVMNVLPAPYGRFILQSGIREAIIHRINNGTFGEKISLHLNTPSNDFITQTRWIPQLPGYLAISSTRNVKIFNFLEDPMCPLFNFKVSDQIHDFTYFFIGTELHLLVLVLSKDGESVFIKKVTDEDKASKHGEVTISEKVQIRNDVLVPKNDLQICSNGTIFYSFQTGVLFLAYTIGSTKKGTHKRQVFFALSCPVFENNCWSVSTVAKMPELSALMKEMLTQKRSFDKDAKSKDAEGLIKLAPNFSSGNTSSAKYVRNLREATGHPGLLTASYGPHSFAITFTESEINVEFLGDVRPILDISAIVHNFRGTEKPTSSILAIAEDGALRGWTINPAQAEKGEYWKNMALQNTQVPVIQETSKEYPPTFLEDFEIITDSELEYQSNQLQRVYNRQRLRRCLEPGNNTNSHYVTWKGPFTLSVKTAKIVRGLRLHFGDNDAQSAPHSVELTQFNRIVTVGDVTQARWFDIILTPEEALNLDGKITLEFVPSPSADRKIVVDAIRLYKTSRRAIMNEKKTKRHQTRQEVVPLQGTSRRF
ncbi:Oidioi.mRNA.OKI2018_I69.PAR.g10942.t1.cds [Oikopleura dioica]|uniref:Oidioi.mRNA.OKI2018_I69.PAR.g10942.t1.cds n=1 Tax=Oikopleura dioica TaxID=34765 RepID=A0ABN7RT95_OIKDI|nr:Oidioi.mRNA.OKI2018_I69.PAR.g10942.t1.cds [Oikopleura dioica]